MHLLDIPCIPDPNKDILARYELNEVVRVFNCEQFHQAILLIELPPHGVNLRRDNDQVRLVIEPFGQFDILNKLLRRHLVTDQKLQILLGFTDFPQLK